MNPTRFITSLLRLAAVLMLALPLASRAVEQKTFATPEAAVEALLAAAKSNDEAAMISLVGEKYKHLVSTGDHAADIALRAAIAERLQTYRRLDERGPDRRVLVMGAQAWPSAVPLVRQGGVWRFAAEEGEEEVLNRRIGYNERSALSVMRAYLDAQREYAARDRNADGVLEYARKLVSTPTKRDGLYWPDDPADGDETSPFGPLIGGGSAAMDSRKASDPYRGYHFRILTRQGANAPGGAYNYIINGRMIGGFALVAYPNEYGVSGVMTFIVSHNGKIFEKDLGKNSHALGQAMASFNPGAGWKPVQP
jgi:hypothetical protein